MVVSFAGDLDLNTHVPRFISTFVFEDVAAKQTGMCNKGSRIRCSAIDYLAARSAFYTAGVSEQPISKRLGNRLGMGNRKGIL